MFVVTEIVSFKMYGHEYCLMKHLRKNFNFPIHIIEQNVNLLVKSSRTFLFTCFDPIELRAVVLFVFFLARISCFRVYKIQINGITCV